MATTYTLSAPTSLLAYSEMESWHPDTGAVGILREEWRAVPFDSDDPRHASMRSPGSFPSMVLECRYIRRGVEEPWTPHSSFEHLDGRYEIGERSFGLLESLLHGHSLRGEIIAVDPRLLCMQEEEHEQAQQRHARRRQIEEELLRGREAKAERRRRGSIAFQKLAHTEEGAALCALWDAFVGEATAEAIERYGADPEFMRLYEAALDEDRVPAKRKAIKALFAYAGV